MLECQPTMGSSAPELLTTLAGNAIMKQPTPTAGVIYSPPPAGVSIHKTQSVSVATVRRCQFHSNIR
jgi:hypothetical protein